MQGDGDGRSHAADADRRGRRGSVARPVRRYKAPLGRFLWPQVGGDWLAVEEILQDVFLTVWRTAPRFRGDARVSTWLFQIAHYRVCHLRRYQARRPRGDAFPLSRDCDSPPSELDLEWQQASHEGEVVRRITLEDALDHLSTQQPRGAGQ